MSNFRSFEAIEEGHPPKVGVVIEGSFLARKKIVNQRSRIFDQILELILVSSWNFLRKGQRVKIFKISMLY